MRVLAIDIETAPGTAFFWSLWDQSIPLARVITVPRVICFAAKWVGERKTVFFSEFEHGQDEMIRRAFELIDEADVVLHYNGKRFDRPHLNREFLQLGLGRPAPYAQIDLLETVKKQFRFVSNKLEHVSTQLGLDGKHHVDFDLWRACLAGDARAWRKMERYNRRDVKELEGAYHVLLPWIPGHPSRRLYDEEVTGCPTCGSDELQRRGFSYTKVSKFQQWHCQRCGSWFRSSRRERGVSIQQDAAS